MKLITKVVIVVTLILLVGCNEQDPVYPQGSSVENDTNEQHHVFYDYRVASDLLEIYESSDVIVVGEFVELTEEIINDPLEDNTYDSYINVYKFRIHNQLLGNNDEEISIYLPRATRFSDGSNPVIHEFFIEPEIGIDYMLFLSEDIHGRGHYYPAHEPYMFSLEGDYFIMKSNLKLSEKFVQKEITISDIYKLMSR